MTDRPNTLGEYLKARRGLVTPEQAGIPGVGVRRIPGLRREEVAMLAGISADYYLRLERGRDRNPSAQVLESLARVLQLDDDHVAYLLSLVGDQPRRPRRRARKEVVPAGMQKLVETLAQPAYVEGRYFDILAANSSATARERMSIDSTPGLELVVFQPEPGSADAEKLALLSSVALTSVGVDAVTERAGVRYRSVADADTGPIKRI